MKLVVCFVHNCDNGKITDELVGAGQKFTIIGSTSGFLREGNTTFLIGAEENEIDRVLAIIAKNCQSREQMLNVAPFETGAPGAFIASPVKVPVGGAVVFILHVERFERY